MEEDIKNLLLDNSEQLLGFKLDSSIIQFQKTKKELKGDVTLVVFPFVKMLGRPPREVGRLIGEFLVVHSGFISSFEVVSGFLNLVVSNSYWIHKLNRIHSEATYGWVKSDSSSLIMVEYSSPNTNKPLHLGHLRNNFLGYSVSKILKANGHRVIKTQVINDRGIHICKSMLAWQRFSPINISGERETPKNTGIKGDKLVGKYYVEFEKQFIAEAKTIISQWQKGDFEGFSEELKSEFLKLESAKLGKDEKATGVIEDKIIELAKNQTSILRDVKDMLVQWEARDPQVYLLWNTMNGWVYEGFDVTYKAMGVDFDKLYFESDTFLLGKDMVIQGLEKGVFFRKSDGSVWIDLIADGLDEKLVLRSDGTAVYMTQDIGTAVDRFKDYPDLSSIIYTVGNEQDYHFKVLFLILQKLGYDWANRCAHLSYGMVDLPSGRMKSREGTVVDADDLMEEVIESATKMTRERGHLEGMNEVEMHELFRVIGMGGLKYYLLKVDPKKRMLFNPEESIELNGNTGPFIQYAHARICSLISKAGVIPSIAPIVELLPEEREIVQLLTQYPGVVKEAGKNLSPALVANYTYELVKAYNHFYQSVYILNEPNRALREFRLIMSASVAKVIRSSMHLLGISVPERM
jgi:arginyl-tRNA synthetase